MPYYSQRILFLFLSALILIFLTALTFIRRPGLNIITIHSPYHYCPCPHQYHGSLSQPEPQQNPVWLLATISAYFAQRRRNIIRATWQTFYPNPAFDTRFVLAKPPPLWQSLIKHENDTYGDLIILEHLNETNETATTIKTVEFLKHLIASSNANGVEPSWKFVSKIDDDSFLSAEQFYQEFLLPRLNLKQRRPAKVTGTLIARPLVRSDRNFTLPGGQFYTLSWDLVHIVAKTHHKNPITDVLEDPLIGGLLYEAGARFDFVELNDCRAFDVTENLIRLSQEKEDLGPINCAAINPHKMKTDEIYLRVAQLFGKVGFMGNDTVEVSLRPLAERFLV